MAERRVLRMGDPLLNEVSGPVPEPDFRGEALASLVTDLWDTMAAYGGVGLAAPQIGVLRRVVVFGLEAQPREGEVEIIPPTVLVNPVITPLDDSQEDGWEGCLSVPGMRGLVPRSLRIRYSGSDAQGKPIEREVDGYHARVVQHECDHLDGILYPQRMGDLSSFGFEEEIAMAEYAGKETAEDA